MPIISIHTLRVEGDEKPHSRRVRVPQISIHTLRVEGDAGTSITTFAVVIFLSTPSGWRATHLLEFLKHFVKISIHTLRVEGDVESDDIRTDQLISIHTLRVEGDSKNGQSFRLFLRKREKNLPL